MDGTLGVAPYLAKDPSGAEAWLAAIVQSSENAIVSKDLDGTITSWNPAAERIFGWSAAEAIGKHISLIIPPELHEEMRSILARVSRGEPIEPFESVRVHKDGHKFPVALTISPIRDASGKILGASKTASDITQQRQARKLRRLLYGAGELLAASLDYRTTLLSVAKLVGTELADWCFIHALDENGELNLLAFGSDDPDREAYAREISEKYPVELGSPSLPVRVFLSGEPVVYHDVTEEIMEASARSEDHLETIRRSGVRSVLALPLKSRDRTIGAMTLISQEPNRYGTEEFDLAQEIARRSALAIDNARLYTKAQQELADRAKAEAELATKANQLQLLYEAGQLLGSTLDPESVYDELRMLVARTMPCDALLVSTIDQETRMILCAYAWVEGQKMATDTFPPVPINEKGDGMQSKVILSGKPLIVLDVPSQIQKPGTNYYTVESDGRVAKASEDNVPQTRSILLCPVMLEGKVIGVVQVLSQAEGAYGQSELDVFQAMVQQMAAASRNALLYQQSREETASRRRAEERFRTLSSAITDVIFTADPRGNFVDDLLRWEQYTGMTSHRYAGRGWISAVHPADRDRVSALWELAVAEGVPFHTQLRLRQAATGSYRYCLARAVPVRNEDRSVREWVGTITDVDETRRAERRSRFLFELSERLRLCSEPHEIIRTLVEAVREHLNTWSVSFGEVLDDDLSLRIACEDGGSDLSGQTYPLGTTPVVKSLHQGKVVAVHSTVEDKRTRENYENVYAPIGIEAFVCVPLMLGGKLRGIFSVQERCRRTWESDEIGLLEEVAQRAWLASQSATANEAVRALNSDLERRVQQRTADLEAANLELEGFTYTVSHDLRAPLRAIVSTCRILVEDYNDKLDDDMRQVLARQATAASKLGTLIDDLLKLSRLGREPLKPECVDLTELSNEVWAELSPRYPNVRFLAQPNLEARADPRLIKLVLANLLDNAAKFSTVAELPLVELQRSPNCEFVVRDNGAGFDMRYKHKLFLPFERLVKDEEFPGTGIGLANVKRIVERHGGSVRAEGQVGEGASFYFSL